MRERRRSPVVMVFLALSIVLFALVAMWWRLPRPVRAVRIEGGPHIARMDIEQVVAPYLDQGWLQMDLVSLRRDLQQLPWVKDAQVWRVWPRRIRVNVTEPTVVVRWGEQQVLDTDGQAFTPRPTSIPKGLPWLWGSEGEREPIFHFWKQTQKQLPTPARITQLTYTPGHAWMLTLDDRWQIKLGKKNTTQRLKRLNQIYPRLPQLLTLKKNHLGVVDLRYPHGFALRQK